ncbi:DNA-3-methyladenine glycosylase [Calidifontibacter terrae]
MAALTDSALDVAPRLLGSLLHGRGVTVRLTEVEAYEGVDDPGSHAFRGPTPRTEVMFGPAGRLYTYLSYGMHVCANYVCGVDGTAAAVLLRAGEVVDGLELAQQRRPKGPARDLARGPARLTSALGLTLDDYGVDLHDPASPVRLELYDPVAPQRIRSGPRVGVSGAGGGVDYPWRFWVHDDPTVSAYRPAKPRRSGSGA